MLREKEVSNGTGFDFLRVRGVAAGRLDGRQREREDEEEAWPQAAGLGSYDDGSDFAWRTVGRRALVMTKLDLSIRRLSVLVISNKSSLSPALPQPRPLRQP